MVNEAPVVDTSEWGAPLPLGVRVDVYPSRPIADVPCPGGPVFAARFKADTRSDLMAVVCLTGFPARFSFANAFRSVDNACILRLREAGVISWPVTGGSCYAFSYDKPVAPLLWANLNDAHAPINEDSITRYFVQPMTDALQELMRIGITHGGIRPTNIFWREGSSTPPQLSEFLSAPAGIGQPILFETIERSLCAPSARGPGFHTDDMYAFGITLAMLILGKNPLKGLDDRAIIQTKMEKGTFNAIVGNQRIAAHLIELLRGLLTDDSLQRWTAEDLAEWVGGRRLTPKNSDSGRRASRSFLFMDKEYWLVRPLAVALGSNVSEAVKVVENKSLERWIIRSLNDQARSKNLVHAVEALREGGKTAHYDEQLATRICIALDPASPIRYRGLSVMPDGIATLLSERIVTGEDTQILSEMIAHQFVSFWVNVQRESKIDLVPLAQQMEKARGYLEKPGLGNGIERVLYELNPTLACQSPSLKGFGVTSVKLLLPALERLATMPNRPSEPMDRHIAAFIIMHEKKGEQIFEFIQSAASPVQRAIAFLNLYTEIQYRFGPDRVPGLAQWLASLLEPALRRFLNKGVQDQMARQMRAIVEKGNLSEILKIIDNPISLARDESDFVSARRLYQSVTKEINELTARVNDREKVAADVGRPMAAAIASFISIILIGLVFVRALIQSMTG